jgi:hypothetical protein
VQAAAFAESPAPALALALAFGFGFGFMFMCELHGLGRGAVSGHLVVTHVPVCRSVDPIFCEDLCADKKALKVPGVVLSWQLAVATTTSDQCQCDPRKTVF